jgi:hypothetical protein
LLKGCLGALHYRPAPGVRALPHPFIAMSRESGAGGTSVGIRVRDRPRLEDSCAMTPWMWFDRELMHKVVEHHNLPKELAGLLDHTQYNRLTRREAEAYVARNDRGRRQFVKDHLNADIDDAHQYAIVINTDHISYEEATDLIVHQVKRIRARIREEPIGGDDS